MADRFTLEFKGRVVRFVREEGKPLLVAVMDLLEAGGFKNGSTTWSKAIRRLPELGNDARYEIFERMTSRAARAVALPIMAAADLLLDVEANTRGGGTPGELSVPERRQRLGALRVWLLCIPDPSSVTTPPAPEETLVLEASPQAAPLAVIPAPVAMSATPIPEVLPVAEVTPPPADSPEEIFSEMFEGHRLRLTPEKPARVSLLDVLAALGYADPRREWVRMQEGNPEFVAEVATYSFGPGRPTPVVSHRTMLKILGVASGPKLARFKEWAAHTLQRYLEGDPTLAKEVSERNERRIAAEAPAPRLEAPRTAAEIVLSLAQEAKTYLELAAKHGHAPEKIGATYARVGEALTLLAEKEAKGAAKLEASSPAYTYTAEELERHTGHSKAYIGRIAGELGLKGPTGEGIPGFSERVIHEIPVVGRPPMQRPGWRYSRAGVDRIMTEIAHRQEASSPTKTTGEDRPSRMARVGTGDKGEVFTRLDDEDPAE